MYNKIMKEKNELDVVKEMLTQWVTAVKLRNSVNDMEINRTSENLVLRLLNLAYDYDLTNLNWEGNNYPAIDLGDREGGIALQVTSTSTLDKIKETLRKFYTIDGPHNEFTKGLYFFFLKEKPPRLKAEVKRKLKTNYGFDPDQQMWSMKTLLTRMEELYSKDRPRFNKVKKILEEEFGGKAMKLEDSITSQPKIVKPGLRTLRRLPPSEQPQDFFTAHISSIVDAGIAKYCPEKHQLYLQFNLDDPESLEKLK